MIVADTSLVGSLLIESHMTPGADRVRALDSDWIAPPVLRYELLDVVGRLEQTNDLDPDEGAALYRRGLSLVRVDDRPFDPLRSLELCRSRKCSFSAVEFARLAMDRGIPLVTDEMETQAAFADVAMSTAKFAQGR
jgi:hypothetical protein